MEVIPKQEEEEEKDDEWTSNNANVLPMNCIDADNETMSACLFVIAPWCLDLDVSNYCCHSCLYNFKTHLCVKYFGYSLIYIAGILVHFGFNVIADFLHK